MYLQIKNELSRLRLSEVRALQTDKCDLKHYNATFAGDRNNVK